MVASTARLSELLRVGDAAQWNPMKNMKAVTAVVSTLLGSSPLNSVTVQLRKATDAAGSNAANLGSAVTGNYGALVTALAEELGNFSATVPFTYVSATITDSKSPNAFMAQLLFEPKDNTPATDPQYVRHSS